MAGAPRRRLRVVAEHQPHHDRRTPAQTRHDAFDRILQAAEEHPDISAVQGATPHLVIYADLFTLLGRDDLASRPTTKLGSTTEVDLDRIIHLLEDAKCSAVLGLGPFRPVAFGRTRRVLPDWLRTILQMIHGTCIGPGCDRPLAWTQAMHTDTDWAHGGTTELDTTAPGCNKHHELRDLIGWHVDLNPDTATATWTSPDRRTTLVTTHPTRSNSDAGRGAGGRGHLREDCPYHPDARTDPLVADHAVAHDGGRTDG